MPLCRPQDWEKYEVGQKVWPSDFLEEGDTVDVHGRSERREVLNSRSKCCMLPDDGAKLRLGERKRLCR